jgi:exodeoxyribonuclease V alpha subunit
MTNVTAARATGLLKTFNEAGVLTAADVHVASRLGSLAGEIDDRVLLAVALVVRGTRHGSVVLDLADAADTITPDADEDEVSPAPDLKWPTFEEWMAACAASPLVTGTAGGPPLQMVGSRLWLDRYWRQEAQVADDLLRRSAARPSDLDLVALRRDLSSLFAGSDEADQGLAAAVAALSRVSVIGGGPGTGKTTTVARLITVLGRQLGPGLRVALAAPTGKAAARLEEAVRSAAGPLTVADRDRLARLSASTLHRLLGRRPGISSRFRHDRENRLPYDVVVVDESSMVSLTLMARLLESLAPATRLVLVGDPDQLASVEAGAVLGDLVDHDDVGPVTAAFRAALAQVTDGVPTDVRPDGSGAALRESVALLHTVHRFDAGGPIAQLAEHVRAGRADDALALLQAQPAGLVFFETDDDEAVSGDALAAVVDRVVAHESAVIEAARAGAATEALDALERHRLLCAHRAGPRGVRWWTDLVERRLALDLRVTPRADGRYAGLPLLVMSNDYETGLYNGDTGVVIRQGEELAAAFRRGGEPIVLPLVRLSDVRPLHAMTVHRGQGSQFDVVTVLLPLAQSPLATRQTFYTAITRAANEVRLVGSADSVLACVQRQAARATGLRDRMHGPLMPISAARDIQQAAADYPAATGAPVTNDSA